MNVVLVGPRRFGKTSFIIDLLKYEEQTHKRPTVLVDIFNITSHRDFLQQLVNALRKKNSLLKKFGAWIKSLPSQFKPILTWENNAAGSVSLQFSPHLASDDQIKQLILETLDSLGNIAPNLCIAFDEFQSVARLEDEGWLEATLRSKMQAHKTISFLFSGSRRSIIHDMFNDNNRPFYRTCQMIDFSYPPEDAFADWIIQRFGISGVSCSKNAALHLFSQVSHTPNYVQMVCFHIVAAGETSVTKEGINAMLHTIVKQNAYAYQTLLNTLTLSQQRILRLAAREKESVHSKEFLDKYEIKSSAHVATALNALKAKQIIDESTKKGKVVFDDPLFALWLNDEFPENHG